MKHNLYRWAALLCVLFFGWEIYAQNAKPFVIPELKAWIGKKGEFIVNEHSRIVYDSPDLNKVAVLFAEDYEKMFGVKLEVRQGKPDDGDFFLALQKDKKLGKEGYKINIANSVKVSAPEVIGAYWATRTLLQMAEQDAKQALPKGDITDFPDYGLRGFMIDCGRKFIPMPYLRDLAEIMSYYKMNTLQVHLNDNGFKQFFGHDWNKTYAAFRLECDTYPGLTARDGFYTKKEFVDFQNWSVERFVEIIPEIDVPAHSLAFSHYMPELGSKEYGADHLDLFNPKTYEFVDALFKEYLEGETPVFVGPKVNIGTDEYSNKEREVVEKFREFTDHYIRLVESYGKQVCMWGALTHAKGDAPVKSENVIMNAWYNGYAAPKEMVKQGYKLVSIPDGWVYIVPAAGYYYDYLDTKMLYEKWTPAQVGDVKFDEKDPAILGGMFAVWNDHVGNGISVKDIHHRTFPALQTLAAKTWCGTNVTLPYQEFDEKRNLLSEAPGVNQLGRWGSKPSLVFEVGEVTPATEFAHKEIGYDYTVSFDIEVSEEEDNTVLFSSPEATVYLADPISGKIGFARDGYLNSFNYKLYPGDKVHVEFSGTSQYTALKINGRLIEKMDIQKRFFDEGKAKMNYVRTLVFPLHKSGHFKSRVFNFKVYNYIL